MDVKKLEDTAKILLTPGKGVLIIDDSTASCEKHFGAAGVTCTKDSRREFRELLVTAPDIEDMLSCVILFDETFWQATHHGQVFREYLKNRTLLPGIKADKGLVDLPGFPGEQVAQGLDGLFERMAVYAAGGARVAKFRAVISLSDTNPTDECIGANTYTLARYARICQEHNVVPIVCFELRTNRQDSDRAEGVMGHMLDILFQTMRAFRVHMPGAVLMTNIVPADDYDEAADRTARVLHGHVPHELAGIIISSTGQKPADTLGVLNRLTKRVSHPWAITFAYADAQQASVLAAWSRDRRAINDHQGLFKRQLRQAAAASRGQMDEQAQGTDPSHSQGL